MHKVFAALLFISVIAVGLGIFAFWHPASGSPNGLLNANTSVVTGAVSGITGNAVYDPGAQYCLADTDCGPYHVCQNNSCVVKH